MTYPEVLANARTCIGQYCKACPVCNGVACKNQIPGPGAKGVGDTAIRNYNKWADIRVNMDTLCPGGAPDTTLELFGKSFRYPFFAGPVGAVNLHYSDTYTDMTYNDVLVRAWDARSPAESSLNTGSLLYTEDYSLDLSGAVQLDWTAQQMEQQTETEYLLDAENIPDED